MPRGNNSRILGVMFLITLPGSVISQIATSFLMAASIIATFGAGVNPTMIGFKFATLATLSTVLSLPISIAMADIYMNLREHVAD